MRPAQSKYLLVTCQESRTKLREDKRSEKKKRTDEE